MVADPPSGSDEPPFSHAEIDKIIAGRVSIEHAKGVLMFIYGLDDGQAFRLLRARSRETGVKLRILAAQLVQDVAAMTPGERLDMESACHNLLLTAHERINHNAEGP